LKGDKIPMEVKSTKKNDSG